MWSPVPILNNRNFRTMLEQILITVCVVVAIAVLAIFVFFFCTRKSCCMSKPIYQRRPDYVTDRTVPDVAIVSDDQGNMVVVSGIHEGVPSTFHWKPPSYNEVTDLPSYEQATHTGEDPDVAANSDVSVDASTGPEINPDSSVDNRTYLNQDNATESEGSIRDQPKNTDITASGVTHTDNTSQSSSNAKVTTPQQDHCPAFPYVNMGGIDNKGYSQDNPNIENNVIDTRNCTDAATQYGDQEENVITNYSSDAMQKEHRQPLKTSVTTVRLESVEEKQSRDDISMCSVRSHDTCSVSLSSSRGEMPSIDI